MTGRYAIVNSGTIAKRITTVAGAGILAVSLLSAHSCANDASREAAQKSKTDNLEMVLSNGYIRATEQIIDVVREDIPQQIEDIETNMRRQEIETALHLIFHPGGYTAATRLLEERMEGLEQPTPELEQLQSALERTTEASLYAMIAREIGDRLPQLCEAYLSMYPNGEEKNDVVRAYVNVQTALLATSIANEENAYQVFNRLEELNIVLEQHTDTEITIPAGLRDQINESIIDQYFSEAEALPSYTSLEIGMSARVVEAEIDNGEYIDDRNASYPIGAEGRVVGFDDSYIFVEFDPTIENRWRKEWSILESYWQGGQVNVAYFEANELEIQVPAIDRRVFADTLSRTVSLLSHYE